MGSGISGLYTGTRGASQLYAKYYNVMPDMHISDEEKGISINNFYTKNPTAQNILEMIHGNYLGNKRTNGLMPYVIDMHSNIIVGKRNGNGITSKDLPTPHPTLIGGKNPQVQCAGMIDIRGGKLYSFNNQSGHYKPNIKSLKLAEKIFSKLPNNIFHKKYKGEKYNE